MNNKIVRLALVLFAICAVTAGILGVVNALTFERIDQITHQKEYEAYAAVLGSESGYTPAMWLYPPSPAPRAVSRWRSVSTTI